MGTLIASTELKEKANKDIRDILLSRIKKPKHLNRIIAHFKNTKETVAKKSLYTIICAISKQKINTFIFDTVWISIKDKSQLVEDEEVEEKVLSDWIFNFNRKKSKRVKIQLSALDDWIF